MKNHPLVRRVILSTPHFLNQIMFPSIHFLLIPLLRKTYLFLDSHIYFAKTVQHTDSEYPLSQLLRHPKLNRWMHWKVHYIFSAFSTYYFL